VLRKGFDLDLAHDLFGLEGIPVARSWVIVILVVALANGTALVASLVPAWRAARLDPAETLRHE
jgi:ABC-type lipoprotein release transport system permease subunit